MNGGRFARPPAAQHLTSSTPVATTLANMAAPATLASQAEVLDRIFAGLKDKNHEVRLQSAIELQRYVRALEPSCMLSMLTRYTRFQTQYRTCHRI